MIQDNPALLDSNLNNSLGLSYQSYVGDLNYAVVQYARSYKNLGHFATSLNYLNYGSFTSTDAYGNETGTFKAADYLVSMIYANNYKGLIDYGVTLNHTFSQLEKYFSYGVSLDLGLSYHTANNGTNLGLVVRNLGVAIVNYREGNFESYPLEVQFSVAYRVGKSPLRVVALFQHLNRFDLQSKIVKNGFKDKFWTGETDNLMRHFVPAIEFTMLKRFSFVLSYNYLKRQELKLANDIAGFTGIAWGTTLRLNRFTVSYSHSTYHFAGSSNYLTFTTNLKALMAPKRKPAKSE